MREDDGLEVAGRMTLGLRAAGCGLQAAGCRVQAAGCSLQVTCSGSHFKPTVLA